MSAAGGAGNGGEDPYFFLDPALSDWKNVGSRALLSSTILAGRRVLVMISKGQSNFSSLVYASRYSAQSYWNLNFNNYNGGLYHSEAPLLGASCGSGADSNDSVPMRVADLLILTGKVDAVVHAPIACNGTTAAQWAPGGNCHQRITSLANRLIANGMSSYDGVIIDMQGESDTATLAVDWTASKIAEVTAVRALGLDFPWLVGLCSYTGSTTYSNVRAGQAAAVNGPLNILQGADTDSIVDRGDGTHFDIVGAPKGANAWFQSVVDGLNL